MHVPELSHANTDRGINPNVQSRRRRYRKAGGLVRGFRSSGTYSPCKPRGSYKEAFDAEHARAEGADY